MKRKLKVIRVVTASYVVPWHLSNTLSRITSDFEVYVVGQNVSENALCYPHVTFVDIDIYRKSSYLFDILALVKLCKFFMSCKPDVVHSVMPKAGLLSAIAGFVCRVPIRLHTFTGQTWLGKVGVARFVYWMLDRFVNRLNTICLTDSFSQSEFLRQHKISREGRPLPVLAGGSLSGVDLTRFQPEVLQKSAQELRLELGIGKDDFVFSFIARKTQEKGAIDALKAFSQVRSSKASTKLLFVGPDEDGIIARLRETNAELFEGVKEVGPVSNHEVYLAASDVLCLPSYREGFGSIVIDAAALGIPTIGSRIPGLVDAIVDGETGLLCAAGDLEELSKSMIRLVNDRELKQLLGNRARLRVDEFFTADKLYVALRDFYFLCAAQMNCPNPSSKTA